MFMSEHVFTPDETEFKIYCGFRFSLDFSSKIYVRLLHYGHSGIYLYSSLRDFVVVFGCQGNSIFPPHSH